MLNSYSSNQEVKTHEKKLSILKPPEKANQNSIENPVRKDKEQML